MTSNTTKITDDYIMIPRTSLLKAPPRDESEKKEDKAPPPVRSGGTSGEVVRAMASMVKPKGTNDAKFLRGIGASTVSTMRAALNNKQHYRFRCCWNETVQTNGSGAVSYSKQLDPNGANFADWSAFSVLFDEFRVISGTIRWVPYNRYSKLSTISAPIVCYFDNDSVSGPATTPSMAWQYSNAKVSTIDDPFEYSFKRPDITASSYWDDVASPNSSPGCVAMYSAGGSPSTIMGDIFGDLIVEFRMRR